jgi:acyl-CoA dehydrogenase
MAMAWQLPPLPFFNASHDGVNEQVLLWLQSEAGIDVPMESGDFPEASRRIAASLGKAGLLRHAVRGVDDQGPPDVRSICLVRDQLAYTSALADFVFAMQGIGALPIWQFGTPEQRRRYLAGHRDGTRVGALALSEPQGGSDVASTATVARREGDYYVLDGVKTWISNGGAAAQYTVIARTGEGQGAKGLSALLVDADTPGLRIAQTIDTMSPHALATLAFEGCRVPVTALLGKPGEGFRIAMSTLDVFRTSVGACALGLARRAFDEALAFVAGRRLFGGPMGELDGVQAKLAEMKMDLDAATLMVYRAAWLKDQGTARITSEASMAKCFGTEAAFRVIDSAVQLFGGLGVTRGRIVERLYRDIRPTRIYEGATEVQKLVVGRHLVAQAAAFAG